MTRGDLRTKTLEIVQRRRADPLIVHELLTFITSQGWQFDAELIASLEAIAEIYEMIELYVERDEQLEQVH